MATAEILSIGTELLLGQILNTNTQFLSNELAEIGIDCFRHVTVGDNKARIIECLRESLERVDVVITTGGLGPTADDLTTECIAEALGTAQIFDEAVMKHIEELFAQLRFKMVESNRKQALRPQGSDVLPNPAGTAPGIVWKLTEPEARKAGLSHPQRTRVIMTFPGVPTEMRAMWSQTGRRVLQEIFGSSAIFSLDLKHYGIGESTLAERVGDLLESGNPTVAPLAGTGECRLRVTAKAATIDEARKLAQPIIDEIRKRSGLLCYGTDADKLETVVGRLLSERQLKLSVAESCTGGLVSKKLTDIPGSSKYIDLNVTTYSNEAKEKILNVSPYILKTKGAVSPECAHAMATGVRKLSGADIGLSITGVAGPDGGTAEKPVGLVYLALVAEHFQTDKTLKLSAHWSRTEIRERTASEALNMVRLYLLGDQQVN